MKSVKSFSILGAAALALVCNQSIAIADTSDIVKVGDRAPEFKANSIDNKVIDLSSFKGKVVVLDFFASY